MSDEGIKENEKQRERLNVIDMNEGINENERKIESNR